MKRSHLLLSSLQRKPPVRSPGNPCNSTGNGGDGSCIGSKKVAGRPNAATAPPPPEFSQSLVQIGEATS
ncbi:hypothetical protein Tco_0342372 [Tanacetum coccineum]